MSSRFVRKLVEAVMNFSISKILAWSVPLLIIAGGLVAIFVLGDKSVLSLLITNMVTAGGSFAVGRSMAKGP